MPQSFLAKIFQQLTRAGIVVSSRGRVRGYALARPARHVSVGEIFLAVEGPATDLSGGQQQRVALARAVALGAKVILMDEPLSNLDARLRDEMRIELKRLTNELGVTTLYVTHDQNEALSLADLVCVMNQGKILQMGKPEDLYKQPADLFVSEFLGQMNCLRGTVAANGMVETVLGKIPLEIAHGSNRGDPYRDRYSAGIHRDEPEQGRYAWNSRRSYRALLPRQRRVVRSARRRPIVPCPNDRGFFQTARSSRAGFCRDCVVLVS